MKLSENALTLVKDPAIRRKLAEELKCTDQSIMRYIRENENNGDLTTAGAMAVIRKETGLTDDQILEVELVKG